MNIEYYIMDPAGNTTALVTTVTNKNDYISVAARIMKTEPTVEQVGFVSFGGGDIKLYMSGGEFCGNATMCAAALSCELQAKKTAQIPVTVFPYKEPFRVTVNKTGSGFFCGCEFKKPHTIKDVSFCADGKNHTFPLVCFKGIMHIIADNTLSKESAQQTIKPLSGKLKAPALGIMLYDFDKKSLLPLVYVSALDTLFFENSCASGSCALAAVLPEFENEISIREPGGAVCAQRTEEGVFLKTNIKIIKKHLGEI